MKIIISYPPLKSEKGTPTLGQNRQFQYFKDPTFIYPVVPATAATMLKNSGFDVIWNDCIAEGIDEQAYFKFLQEQNPNVIAFETKTPVVKQHWEIIRKLKSQLPQTKFVLFGDHVTALPEESFQNSSVDFVLTGGDYDFLLLSLCRALSASGLQAERLEPGIWYREKSSVKNTGKFELDHDLNHAPFIDRVLTKWELYAYKNGNFKRTPGTYIMSGRDCWWGKCSFCSWPTLYPWYRTRSVENVLDEIGELIERYQIKEIMDDTGTFPVGEWLYKFCEGMIVRGYHKRVILDCNMRFGALNPEEYRFMKKAGFRLLLFGLESANQNTLERVRKNVKVEQVIESCKNARRAGLYPHITIMFGYPWETYKDAQKTLGLGRWLLKKGYAYTVQATIVIPYPGSSLFEECEGSSLLATVDWSRYDMKESVIKTSLSNQEISTLVRGIYSVAFHPEFIVHRIPLLFEKGGMTFAVRACRKVIGHLVDFRISKQ